MQIISRYTLLIECVHISCVYLLFKDYWLCVEYFNNSAHLLIFSSCIIIVTMTTIKTSRRGFFKFLIENYC